MQILFVHQDFLGPYCNPAHHFAASPDWECYAIGEKENVKRQLYYIPQNGLKLLGYDAPKKVPANLHGAAKEFAEQLTRAQSISTVL